MSRESDPLLSRHVDPEQAPRGTTVGCPIRGCGGTVYALREGEHLSRRARPGWRTESRSAQCDRCGHRQALTVQLRGTET
jgi:hypothetical protein